MLNGANRKVSGKYKGQGRKTWGLQKSVKGMP